MKGNRTLSVQRRADAKDDARWLLETHNDALTTLERKYLQRVVAAAYTQSSHVYRVQDLTLDVPPRSRACRMMLQRVQAMQEAV